MNSLPPSSGYLRGYTSKTDWDCLFHGLLVDSVVILQPWCVDSYFEKRRKILNILVSFNLQLLQHTSK